MIFPAWFKNASIVRKFIYIAFLATTQATLFAIVLSTLMQWFMLREELVHTISAHASIIAANSTEELLSNNREEAKNTLSALANIDSIEFAGILDSQGNDFALYVQPGKVMPIHHHYPVESEYHIHTAQYIEIIIPVVFKQERIGMLHVRSSMAPVYEKLAWNILILVAAAVGAFLIAIIMLLLLLPTITDPIQYLVTLMKKVSQDKDFLLRSELNSHDELGTLSEGFNAMLEQIQMRDHVLEYHQMQLEEDVAQRTAILTEAQRIAHLGNWEWDILTNTLEWSDEVYRIFGLTSQQFGATYEAFLQTVHPEDRQVVDTDIRKTLDQMGNHPYSIDHRILLPDGTIRHVHEQGEVFRDKEGKPIRMIGTIQDITERKHSEEALKDAHEQLSILLNSLPIAVYRCRAEGDYAVMYMSENVLSFTGFTPQEFMEKPDLWLTHIHPDDKAKVATEMEYLFEKGAHTYEYRWQSANGKYIWIQDSLKLIVREDGTPIYMIGMWENITERKHMELKLRASEERFRHLAELTTDWVWEVDKNGTYVYSGENVYNLLGYTPEEICGKTPFDFMTQEEAERVGEIFKKILSEQKPFSFLENTNLHKDGHKVILETSGIPLYNEEGTLQGYFGTEHDVTERKQIEEEIKRLATTDTLTGIANRREFNTQLEKEIERSKRYSTPLSLIMYDIDYFKRVNDTFGHDAGDAVLQTLTTLVKSNIRTVDIVARWGGEEFMILMPQSNASTAAEAAEKLRQKIVEHPFEPVGKLTVSFGVTPFEPQDDLDGLIKRVDDALYQAKEHGRNRVEILL
ncbi:PAS domain-containing protein [Sulfuricurvum sp.]|uniref:PAS domain-containing protein n=1 Tax=Sulfuricurvum sp. TaxID=2025608 RepID=UPI003564825B